MYVFGLSLYKCLEEISLALVDDCSPRTTTFRQQKEIIGNFSLEVAKKTGMPRTFVIEENVIDVRKVLDEYRSN